jgi:hypothetical protein
MSCFILAILLVQSSPGTIPFGDESPIVQPVKSAIPQTLDAPKMTQPKATDKASTKPSDAKKKSKKK